MKDFLILGESAMFSREFLSDVCDFEPQNGANYLVSNAAGAAEIHAAEIDYLIAKSKSDKATKTRMIRAILEARSAVFDNFLEQKINYDPALCHFHDKASGACARCAAACPNGALVADTDAARIKFAPDLCRECGACAGVCPTGAIEFGAFGKEAICAAARAFAGFTPFLIAAEFDLDLELELPAGAIPFVVPNFALFNEFAYWTFFEETGSQIVIAGELNAAAKFANDLAIALYNKSAILTIGEIGSAAPIVKAQFAAESSANSQRAALADRVKGALARSQIAKAPPIASEIFGSVAINAESCSLCAACAQNCATNAITASETEGVLWVTNALCTMCGECATICPEKSISLEKSGLVLEDAFFARREAARDTAFCCVECGKPFAASRAAQKVIALMSPIFASDAAKLRSLSCCPDCKVKVMMGETLKKSVAK
ncbi:MAG: 4Fe-4S binding protein [Helicobacteraceae bacterium]|nr:4Fe-4S binding protein [Helicobacteraceae bacterium]